MSASVSVKAFAKINWGLELLGKRDDGYHEILTVTQTISLHDSLRVSTAPGGITISVDGDWPAPVGPDNICWRAAGAFQQAHGRPDGVNIALTKRIPPGAGLGGGSSDCIAVLAALSFLTGIDAPQVNMDIAAALGSDTVLFLHGGAAVCSGRGEIVRPIRRASEYNLVIARPEESVSTGRAYSLLDPSDYTGGEGMQALVAALGDGADAQTMAGILFNAFSSKVMGDVPSIRKLQGDMIAAGAAGAQMTGSGSAVFGIAPTPEAADAIGQRLNELGYWAVSATPTDAGYLTMEGPTDE